MLLEDDKNFAETLVNYFVIVTAGLELSQVKENLITPDKLLDPIDIAVNIYKCHPNVRLIKQRIFFR